MGCLPGFRKDGPGGAEVLLRPALPDEAVPPLLEGDAGSLIPQDDGAALSEAQAGHGGAHGGVALVGVHPEDGAAGERPVGAETHDAPELSGGGQAVDDAVGRVVRPRAAVDHGVGGFHVPSRQVAEDGLRYPGLLHHEGPVLGDVLADQVFAGVAVDPLDGVAVPAHVGAGNVKELHQPGKLRFPGGADVHRRSSFGKDRRGGWAAPSRFGFLTF